MTNAIEIKSLNKTYAAANKQEEKVALKNIDLAIPKGSIFGLLGPNGAGKSTLINILAGLVIKTAGDVKIWDENLDQSARNAKAAIGIVPQEINFDPFFTPFEILEIQGGLYGVPKKERRTLELLKMVNLEDKAHAHSRALSGGMKRRLMVAKALVHTPPILVLDEPTAGVDVELRKMLWENVRRLNDDGVTVVLTTHYLEEAEELCDQIAIIDRGEIVANEDKETLLSRINNKEVRFRLDKELKEIPKSLEKFDAVKEGKRTILVRYSPAEQQVSEILDAIKKEKLNIADISTDESDLEDVFLQITKH